MKTDNRHLSRIFIALIALVFVSIVFVFVWPLVRGVPEIARGIPIGYEAPYPPFTQRLQQRFPIGSDEEKLVRALRKQGFETVTRSKHGSGEYAFGGGWPVCGKSVVVYWTTDDQRRLTALEGRFGLDCL